MEEKYLSAERTGIAKNSLLKKISKVCKSYEEWFKESTKAIEGFESGVNAPFHISFDDTNKKYRAVCRVSSKDYADAEKTQLKSVGMRAGRGGFEWFADLYKNIEVYKEGQISSWALQSALTSYDDSLTKPEGVGRVAVAEKIQIAERQTAIAFIQALLKNGVDPMVICPQHKDLIKMVKEELDREAKNA
jgi:hypothetical protein